MTRLAGFKLLGIGAAVLVLGPGLGGCSLDTIDNGPGYVEDDPENPLDDEEIVCSRFLEVSGTLEPEGEPPDPLGGCEPFGTWTVNVVITDDGGCDEVPVESQYVYVVGQDEEGWYYEFIGDTDAEVEMSVRGKGGGECAGTFIHTLGNHYIVLKPVETNLTLLGTGRYDLMR
jgi:hypothetical protein